MFLLIRRYYLEIPSLVRTFLLRSLLAFAIFQGYFLGWELRNGTVNAFLTEEVGKHSVSLLNAIQSQEVYRGKMEHFWVFNQGNWVWTSTSQIYFHGSLILHLADACNGLEMMALFLGFILCVPGRMRLKAWFIPLGLMGIYSMNVFRCVGLVLVYQFAQPQFDIAHHYWFKMVVYGFIFFLWYLFLKLNGGRKKSKGSVEA